MKILYARDALGQDYLNDCVLHGLRQLDNIEVIDEPFPWYMYKSNFGPGKHDLKSIYGRGFTIFGTLDDVNVDRTEIVRKIQSKYFDLVILSRVDHLPSFYKEVFEHYTPNQIAILDGEDGTGIRKEFYGKAIYFKRELTIDDSKIFPIGFGFPKEKISNKLPKEQVLSRSIPNYHNGYIFDNETDYYNDYNISYFGITHRKSGWDCMRHYEIIGSNCLPYFKDIKSCPTRICENLPKELFIQILDKFSENSLDYVLSNEGQEIYFSLQHEIMNHFLENGTTDRVANRILEIVGQFR